MFRASGILLFVALGVWLWFALFGPALPPLEPTSASPVLTKPAIERAVEDCRLLLGWRDDTVMTQERMALFALCMRPELKQGSVSK